MALAFPLLPMVVDFDKYQGTSTYYREGGVVTRS